MADKKITQLTNITGANLVDADEFVVVDISADETKAITLGELKEAFDSGSGFVRITGDTMTGDLALSGADVTFGDNDKAIFGAGSDLSIYSDGANSFIKEAGAGGFYLDAQNINIRNAASNETFISAVADSAVTLYHNNSSKLATTSTGVDITGTLTSDGLLVEGEVAGQGASIEAHATVTEFGDALLIARSDNASNNLHAGVKVQGSSNPFYIYQTNGANTNKLRFNYNAMSDAGGQMTIDNNGDISFYEDTGTTPKFFWDASAESLGIGTSSPGDKLSVWTGSATGAGQISIGRTSADGGLFVAGGSNQFFTSTAQGDVGLRSDGGDLWVGTAGADVLHFVTNNSEKMRIDPSGKVGIGESSPDTSLDVVGGSADSVVDTLTLKNDSTGSSAGVGLNFVVDGVNDVITSAIYGQRTGAAYHQGSLQFITNDNAGGGLLERMRITSSGNVGIGTSSPTQKLVTDGNIFASTGDGGGYLLEGNSGILRQGITGMGFNTNGSERMRIDSSGNLLVGKTAQSTSTNGIQLQSDYTVSSVSTGTGYFYNKSDGGSGTAFLFRSNNSNVGSISVTASSTAYNTSSDYRLKENVVAMTGATDRLKQLNPSRFNFIADADTTVDGFLAHEVQAIVPEAISGEKDAVDADGNPEYQGIDQSKLVPLLTAALQEALTKIDALETRITALEG